MAKPKYQGKKGGGKSPGFPASPSGPPASPEPASGLLLVGKFGAPQGVRGDIRIRSFTQDPLALAGYEGLTDASGQTRFVIDQARLLKDGVLIACIAGVNDRTAAAKLTNLDLYIHRDDLPETGEEEYYVADLIGLEARLNSGKRIGTITQVDNFGAGDILTIAQDDGAELQLLFSRANVPDVNLAEGWIAIAPPAEVDARSDEIDPG